MKNLFLIYGHNPQLNYTIYGVFEPHGGFDTEALASFFQEERGHQVNPSSLPYISGILSFEELKNHAFELCRERRCDRIVLLSLDDYNQALEENSSPEEFFKHLSLNGESLENLGEEGSKGLLGKLFR